MKRAARARGLVVGGGLLLTAPLLAPPAASAHGPEERTFAATLRPVPHDPAVDGGSTARGQAEFELRGVRLRAEIEVRGVSPRLRHLMHVHGSTRARNECPDSLAYDTDGDGLISVPEGAVTSPQGRPGYGPVQVSFTTSGDVGAASGGALDRMAPADAAGRIDYARTFRLPTPVDAVSPAALARAFPGLHVVVHGHDIDGNGAYDSPLELSLPVACGAINRA
jgi:hypothetical protein